MRTKIDSALVGEAGEHLVLSRLLIRGALAAQAPRGTHKVDVLVNFLDDRPPVMIQVKARTYGTDGGWHMGEKHESQRDEDVFYCFVDFEPEDPAVFVIPSPVVADAITVDHATWLATPGRNGQPHKPTGLRRLRPRMYGQAEGWIDAYLEAWNLILDPR